jgi:hypothetical protein
VLENHLNIITFQGSYMLATLTVGMGLKEVPNDGVSLFLKE